MRISFKYSIQGVAAAGLCSILTVLGGCDGVGPTAPIVDMGEIIQLGQILPVLADGESRVMVIATIPEEASSENRTVKFVTEAGSFIASGEQKEMMVRVPDGQDSVEVELKAGKKHGTFYVSAAVGVYVDRQPVEFMPARPMSLRVETDRASANLLGTLQPKLSAILERGSGAVSDDLEVFFSKSMGRITGVTKSKDGKATATFAADQDATAGAASITVSTVSDGGGIVSDTIFISVISP